MVRSSLFALMTALCVVTVTVPVLPAHAENGKGIMSLFNRSRDDGPRNTSPIHMQPNMGGQTSAPRNAPINLSNTGSYSKPSTYENSPIHAQARAEEQILKEWGEQQAAAASARGAQAVAAIEARIQQDEMAARAEQAKLIQQTQARMSAGMSPADRTSRALGATPLPTSLPATPAPSTSARTAPGTADDSRPERRQRQFFNRID